MQTVQKTAFITGIILIFLTPFVLAQTSEQNLREAILKNGGNFTEEQLEEMDQNNDGKLDVSDIVNLLKSTSASTPVSNFDSFTSVIEEGNSTANIKVNFSTAFSGALEFTITGTATNGNDYEVLNSSIPVDGAYVNIPVAVTDDDTLEETAETIVLTLNEGSGYVPGASTTHTIYIYDNDAVWNGTIETNGTALHFQMKIIQTPTKTTGALFTDGYGIIPLNGTNEEWAADYISLSPTLFSAIVDRIDIPKSHILANVDLERKFVFQANSQQGDIVEPDSEIIGKVDEFVTCSSAKQFEYHSAGTFILLKPIPNVAIQSLPLEDAK
ncbi:MAG: hypothetical protein GY749_06905 [Desulfobacteraceae bacterium]|nr:hypothetical protein [Desulfobacteraceae bacterium]